ncbi:hypothetical protein E2C01_062706 [Portunus trituberculatus]|uniref:Uncharacterized protein n=1 Tax=Portunus trituberculatus TaxID=210409 RepID=A0A5B7HIS6_PORTR|nr:hypothetical protein [Portunus trituberculatus]
MQKTQTSDTVLKAPDSLKFHCGHCLKASALTPPGHEILQPLQEQFRTSGNTAGLQKKYFSTSGNIA